MTNKQMYVKLSYDDILEKPSWTLEDKLKSLESFGISVEEVSERPIIDEESPISEPEKIFERTTVDGEEVFLFKPFHAEKDLLDAIKDYIEENSETYEVPNQEDIEIVWLKEEDHEYFYADDRDVVSFPMFQIPLKNIQK